MEYAVVSGVSTLRDAPHGCGQSPTYFTGSDVRVRDPDLPLLHWAIAFKGAAWTDPDAIPLMVIQSIIGAWNKNAGAGAPLPCLREHLLVTYLT